MSSDSTQAGTGGDISYRLKRQSTVAAVRAGNVSRTDVCDAHPQLVRAAREVGKPTELDCPICLAHRLVQVTYVFGSRLPRHGRCISYDGELAKLAESSGNLVVYVVECCTDCGWNHLVRSYPLARAGKPGGR